MLKNHVLAITLTVLSSPLMAEGLGGDEMNTDELCDGLSSLSEKIMEARQAGVSLSNALGIVQTEATRMIVMDAWESPRYSTESVIQREIEDFRDRWHLTCLRAMSARPTSAIWRLSRFDRGSRRASRPSAFAARFSAV